MASRFPDAWRPAPYRVRCRKQVHARYATHASDDVWLERSVDLPYPPYPGLTLRAGAWQCHIRTVEWDLDAASFVAQAHADRTLYDFDRQHPSGQAAAVEDPRRPRLADLVDAYVAAGWREPEPE